MKSVLPIIVISVILTLAVVVVLVDVAVYLQPNLINFDTNGIYAKNLLSGVAKGLLVAFMFSWMTKRNKANM